VTHRGARKAFIDDSILADFFYAKRMGTFLDRFVIKALSALALSVH
jgi:hypothetical protein